MLETDSFWFGSASLARRPFAQELPIMAWRKAIGILAICATFLPVAARLSGGEEIVDQSMASR
jgi:hypothetical protein